MNIAIVYKSGGDYNIQYVKAIVQALNTRGKWEGEIYCFTDREAEVSSIRGVTAISLLHNWPGWWSKIELFRPGIFKEAVLYLDLDTFILSDLFELIHLCEGSDLPIFARDASDLATRNNWLASPVMSWRNDYLRCIYDQFLKYPERHINYHRKMSARAGQHGDQGFIRLALDKSGYTYRFFQDLLPKNYMMFKRQVTHINLLLKDCHLLNWGGRRMRPHLSTNPFHSIWQGDVADYESVLSQFNVV